VTPNRAFLIKSLRFIFQVDLVDSAKFAHWATGGNGKNRDILEKTGVATPIS